MSERARFHHVLKEQQELYGSLAVPCGSREEVHNISEGFSEVGHHQPRSAEVALVPCTQSVGEAGLEEHPNPHVPHGGQARRGAPLCGTNRVTRDL